MPSMLAVTLPSSLAPQTALMILLRLRSYTKQVLCYARAWDVVLKAVVLSQHCVMAHLLAADFWIARNDMPNASRALKQAKEAYLLQEGVLTPWEKEYFRGYSLMMQNDLREALRAFVRAVELEPTDLFAVKKSQLLAFVLGGRADMLRATMDPRVQEACATAPYFHAMHAFALEENGRFDDATIAVEKALHVEPHDPWAVHVQAHLFYARGALREGVAWLEARSDHWAQCMSFLYSHCWFHVGLLRLDLDEYAQTLALFDRHVWPHYLQDQDSKRKEANGSAGTGSGEQSGAAQLSPSVADPHNSPSTDGATSFGEALGPLSFPRNDRFYIEDHNAALNLLWRMDIRWAGRGRLRGLEAATSAEAGLNGAEGEAVHAEKKRRLSATGAAASSSSAASATSAAPASPAAAVTSPSSSPGVDVAFPPQKAALSARFEHVVSCLPLPPSQPLSLFGLLQLHALCRAGRLAEAQQVCDLMAHEVRLVADAERRMALSDVLLPSARAIVAAYDADALPAPHDRARAAFALLRTVLYDPPAPVHTAPYDEAPSANGGKDGPPTEPPTGIAPGIAPGMEQGLAKAGAEKEEQLKSTTGAGAETAPTPAAEPAPANGAATSSPTSAASTPNIAHLALSVCRPAHSGRLGCLSASGEQLEVLVEFFLEAAAVAAAAGDEPARQVLLRALEDKRATRGTVLWYHRMQALTGEQ